MIIDGAQHRYIQISLDTYRTLSLWGQNRKPTDLIKAALTQFGLVIDADQITSLITTSTPTI